MRADWRLSVVSLPRSPFSGARSYLYDTRHCKKSVGGGVLRWAKLHDLASGNTLACAKPDIYGRAWHFGFARGLKVSHCVFEEAPDHAAAAGDRLGTKPALKRALQRPREAPR